MDEKFTKKEIREITEHFKTFVDAFDNTLKSEVKIEDDNVLVLSFTCEEKQYRNYKKDRVGFRGIYIRVWKETPDEYMGSMSTFAWVIPYRHRNKRTTTCMSILKGKLADMNSKIFDKLRKEILQK